MKYYKIAEDELLDFIESDMRLCALINGGVDNWEWYGVSLGDFIEHNKENYSMFKGRGIDPEDIDFSDMAKAELEDNWLDKEIYLWFALKTEKNNSVK